MNARAPAEMIDGVDRALRASDVSLRAAPRRPFADEHRASEAARASVPAEAVPSLPTFASDFPAVIDLGALDGDNGFRIDGVASYDNSGRAVSSAGDFNGDGIDDLIIGAFRADPGGDYNAGAGYIVFGKTSNFSADVDLASLDGSNGFRLAGVDPFDVAGRSVSSAGDVNGDGFDDVIIGAYLAARGAEYEAGESYIVFGKAAPFAASVDLATLDGANGFSLRGINQGDWSGYSVSGAGDVNGDGFADVIIGARRAAPGDLDAGQSYVVFGKAGGFGAAFNLAALNGSNGFRLSGIDAGDRSGVSVSSAGDVNDDGFDDVVIGASNAFADGDNYAGESYVVFGKAGGFAANLNLAKLDGSNGFRLDGVEPFDNSGYSVSDAGDVNGDGFGDIIIGALGASPGSQGGSGASYIVFGKDAAFAPSLDLAMLDGTNGFRVDGVDSGDFSGVSVSAAGDVNGDGFDDIIIGAPSAQVGSDPQVGESYVVFGKATGFPPNIELANLDGSNGFVLQGIDGTDRSGTSISSAGDVNGDGFADIVIGAYHGSPGFGLYAGESYVVFGRAPTEAVERIGSAADQVIRGGDFKDTLAGRGGDDTLVGGGQADTLNGGVGADMLDGGSGSDWADYSDAALKVRVDLRSPHKNLNEAAGDSYVSIENLRGSSKNDGLRGDANANILDGRDKNDKLAGRDGDDTLIGGEGQDTLDGGAGADQFRLTTIGEGGPDRIRDFAVGEDGIALDGSVFGLPPGALDPDAFVLADSAQDAQDRLIYNSANGKLFFDPDGTGATAQVQIATITNLATLTANDLTVI